MVFEEFNVTCWNIVPPTTPMIQNTRDQRFSAIPEWVYSEAQCDGCSGRVDVKKHSVDTYERSGDDRLVAAALHMTRNFFELNDTKKA